MNKVLILLGPTGVGKTGASILLAEKLDTEIISADSMQIYRNMDIGTAKPAKEELKAVRHHMIDIIPPTESYSVGQYIQTVIPVIDRLQGEGRIPVIVGGTGLYIKAVTRGIFSGPSADWTLRDELLSAEQAEKGYLFAYIQEIDPEASKKIDRNDIRRIVRAIEVCLKSREKISLLQKRFTRPILSEFIKIGLTRERRELYDIIEKRVDGMIQAGLQEETENILKMNPEKTPLQAIGYKEIAMYLDGKITMEEAVTLVKRNSRRYAKRQFTWFRKEEAIKWIDVTGIHDSTTIFNLIKDMITRSYPGIPFRK